MRPCLASVAVAVALAQVAPAAGQTTLKIATLAPEGSAWMRLFHAWKDKVEARTDGRVKVRFYAGGAQGDERDVLRKIRLGQLAGGAVTGIGLSSISPEARALEIARTDEQLDGLRAVLDADIRRRLEEKGWILVGWGDVGPVHLFSRRPVKTLDDLRGTKLWLWSDDPISRELFAALGVHGVPLGVPEVLPGLATGQIDAFFGSPLSTLALQWGAHARAMSAITVSQATGATVLAKKVWDALAPADRQILAEEAAVMQAQVLRQVRADNDKALAALQAQGMVVVAPSPELARALDEASEAIARAHAGDVGKAFADKVQKLVDDYRAGAPGRSR